MGFVVCGKCFEGFEDDSVYCPECGSKQLLFDDKTYSSDSMPVAIRYKFAFLDGNNPYVRISLYNKGEKTINACKIKVSCKDPFGDDVEATIIKMIDLNAEQGGDFGFNNIYKILSADARSFEFSVEQVVFDDGEVWYNDNTMSVYYLEIDEKKYKAEEIKEAEEEVQDIIDESIEDSLNVDYELKFDLLLREGTVYYNAVQEIRDSIDDDELEQELITSLTNSYLKFVGSLIDGLDKFIIPDYVTEIRYNYFLGVRCDNLDSDAEAAYEIVHDMIIVLPKNLKKVGKEALSSLNINRFPSSLEFIDERAFFCTRINKGEDIVLDKLQFAGEYMFSGMEFVDGFIPSIRICNPDIDICDSALFLKEINELEIPSCMNPISLDDLLGYSTKVKKVILNGTNTNNYMYDEHGNVLYNYDGDMMTFWNCENNNKRVISVYSDYKWVENEIGLGDRSVILDYIKSNYPEVIDIDGCKYSLYESVELVKWRGDVASGYYDALKCFPNIKVIKAIDEDICDDLSYSNTDDDDDFKFASEKGIAIINDYSSDDYIIRCIDRIESMKSMIYQKYDNQEIKLLEAIKKAKKIRNEIDDEISNGDMLDKYVLYLALYYFYLERIWEDEEGFKVVKYDDDYCAADFYGEYENYESWIYKKCVTPYLKRMLLGNTGR